MADTVHIHLYFAGLPIVRVSAVQDRPAAKAAMLAKALFAPTRESSVIKSVKIIVIKKDLVLRLIPYSNFCRFLRSIWI